MNGLISSKEDKEISGLASAIVVFLLTDIYSIQIYNNSLLPPGGNGGVENVF